VARWRSAAAAITSRIALPFRFPPSVTTKSFASERSLDGRELDDLVDESIPLARLAVVGEQRTPFLGQARHRIEATGAFGRRAHALDCLPDEGSRPTLLPRSSDATSIQLADLSAKHVEGRGLLSSLCNPFGRLKCGSY
jgi:hypothetical protein